LPFLRSNKIGSLKDVTKRLRDEFNCGDDSERLAKLLLDIDPIFQESLAHWWHTGELKDVPKAGPLTMERLLQSHMASSIPEAFEALNFNLHLVCEIDYGDPPSPFQQKPDDSDE